MMRNDLTTTTIYYFWICYVKNKCAKPRCTLKKPKKD